MAADMDTSIRRIVIQEEEDLDLDRLLVSDGAAPEGSQLRRASLEANAAHSPLPALVAAATAAQCPASPSSPILAQEEEEDGEDGDVGPPKETAPAPKKASPKKANKTSAASKVTPKPTTGGRSRISRENAAKAFDRYGNSTDDLKTYYEAAFEEPLKPGHYMTNYEIRALLWEHEYDPRKSN